MASGDTLIVLRPGEANFPPASEAGSISVNEERVLTYPDDGDHPARFEFVMPRIYTAGVGLRARLRMSMASATAGDVDLLFAWERRVGKSLRTRTFAAPITRQNIAVPANPGEEFTVNANANAGAQSDSIVAGDLCALRVRRRGSTDTAVGDLLIHGIEIEER